MKKNDLLQVVQNIEDCKKIVEVFGGRVYVMRKRVAKCSMIL